MFDIFDPYFLSVVAFFAVLGLLIYKDRKNMEFHTLMVMRRTERFKTLIDRIANISPRFWKAAAVLGILMAIYVMFYGSFLLLSTAGSVLLGLIKQPALQLILPSPTATGASGPGYMLIPFWFWIITICSILVPHELMHGIVARAEKIRLKSVGLMLLAIFPGAFVEPDERQLQKAKLLTRLRIFAAGSFANFSTALIIIGLFAFLIWPVVFGTGIILETVADGSPAALAGLASGQLVTQVNSKPITSSYWEFTGGRGYLYEEVGAVSVGDTVSLVADGKSYVMEAAKNAETGAAYIGVTYTPVMSLPAKPFFEVANLFAMIWVFSLAVGMVNILPIYPLDGGLMFEAVAKKYLKNRRAKIVTRATAYHFVLVMVFDFFGPWILSFLQLG